MVRAVPIRRIGMSELHFWDVVAGAFSKQTGAAIVNLATDVHYTANGATAAGVAFSNWDAERPERLYVSRSKR